MARTSLPLIGMSHRPRPLSWIVTLVALCLTATAHAQSGLQLTPDGRRILVSKDVGAERWAIARAVGDGKVSGNVFFPGGEYPRFVWCEETSSSVDQVLLDCSGSDRCLLAPCGTEAWAFLASVTLPRSFFEPRQPAELLSCSATAQLSPQATVHPSGLQLSPGESVTLVSKDVGPERWAIARNADDGSVTGNVFFPDGGEPRFVWCRETGRHGSDLDLSCQGADACGATCSAADWKFIADVTLAEAFFQPRSQVTLEDAGDRVSETLGDDDGFVAITLAYDRGYSVSQILHAISDARLSTDGRIRRRAGSIEPPAGTPSNFFLESLPASGEGGSVRQFLQIWKGNPEMQVYVTHELLLRLLDEGYDLDQIVGAVTENRLRVIAHQGPIVLDARGNVLPPARPPSGQTTGTPTGPEPTPTPGPAPTPTTTAGADCGNGRIDTDEECDGALLDGATCRSLGFASGTLRCNGRCRYDVTACSEGPEPTPSPTPQPPPCDHDDVAEPGEECDGSDLRGATCRTEGFAGGGLLGCSSTCSYDTSGCIEDPDATPTPPPVCESEARGSGRAAAEYECCNDGILQGSEACDGADLGGQSCATLGFDDGTLRCTSTCTLDSSGCFDRPTPTPTPVCNGLVCPDGICVPGGADCCGGGLYCAPGKVCVPGGCCPSSLPQICASTCIPEGAVCCGGGAYCDAGEVCVAGNSACCPASLPQLCGAACIEAGAECCPGGGSCTGGTVCTGVPGTCCPAAFPQLCGAQCIPEGADCCGGGAGYCPPGSHCHPDGSCGSGGAASSRAILPARSAFGKGSRSSASRPAATPRR